MPIHEFEGQQHDFPADFTDADISKALAQMHPIQQKGMLQSLGEGIGRLGGAAHESNPLSMQSLPPNGPPSLMSELSNFGRSVVPGPGSHEAGSLLNLVHAIPFAGPSLDEIASGKAPEGAGHLMGPLGIASPTGVGGFEGARPLIKPGGTGTSIASKAGHGIARFAAGKIMPMGGQVYDLLRNLVPSESESLTKLMDEPDFHQFMQETYPGMMKPPVPNLGPRPAPDWQDNPAPVTTPPPKIEPIAAPPRVKLTEQSRTPTWQGVTEAGRASIPKLEPIPSELPSKNVVGKPDPFVGPVKPIESAESAIQPINNKSASAPTVKSVKHPPSHTDLIRQLHANAQDFELPGSAAGQKGTQQLRNAAKAVFGTDSLKELSYEQALVLNEYMLRKKQGLKTSLPQSKADLIQGLQE